MDNASEWGDVDTRIVLRVYSVLTGLGGFVIAAWGQIWLGNDLDGVRWGKAALIRVFGSILIGGACCAWGLASIPAPAERRSGLLWFAIGHAVVGLVVLSQRMAIWGPGTGDLAAQVLVAMAASLFFLWYMAGQEFPPGRLTTLFGSRSASAPENLHSRYERQIREAAAQEERNRLARELHDSIKQQIFVIQTAAATVQARFEGDAAGARQALEQVRASAHDAMLEMEVMLDQLRAEPLENAGLVAALKKQCEAMGFRSGAPVDFRVGELPASETLRPGAQQAILRVAQEALANIARHARAAHVWVSLAKTPDGVELMIRDDGTGFDPNQVRRGMGTANMHARADEFGGSFELLSRPGEGTSVRFAIPYASRGRFGWNARTLFFLWWMSMLLLTWRKSIFTLSLVGILSAIYLIADYRARKRNEAAR